MSIFEHSLNYENIFDFIQNEFATMIYIRRKNLLKRLVSNQKSNQSKVWHVHANYKLNRHHHAVHLNLKVDNKYLYQFPFVRKQVNNATNSESEKVSSLYDFLKIYSLFEKQMFDYAKNNISNVIDIVYEDHTEKNPLVAVNKITNCLELKQHNDYNIPLQKIGKSLVDELQNYEEVYNHLKDTEFEWMLE